MGGACSCCCPAKDDPTDFDYHPGQGSGMRDPLLDSSAPLLDSAVHGNDPDHESGSGINSTGVLRTPTKRGRPSGVVHAADSTPLLLDNARLEDGRSTRDAMANGNARFTRTDVGRRGNRGGAPDGRTEILSSAELISPVEHFEPVEARRGDAALPTERVGAPGGPSVPLGGGRLPGDALMPLYASSADGASGAGVAAEEVTFGAPANVSTGDRGAHHDAAVGGTAAVGGNLSLIDGGSMDGPTLAPVETRQSGDSAVESAGRGLDATATRQASAGSSGHTASGGKGAGVAETPGNDDTAGVSGNDAAFTEPKNNDVVDSSTVATAANDVVDGSPATTAANDVVDGPTAADGSSAGSGPSVVAVDVDVVTVTGSEVAPVAVDDVTGSGTEPGTIGETESGPARSTELAATDATDAADGSGTAAAKATTDDGPSGEAPPGAAAVATDTASGSAAAGRGADTDAGPDAVASAPAPAPAAAPIKDGLQCSACDAVKKPSDFSKAQKKKNGQRRCKDCIAGITPVPASTADSLASAISVAPAEQLLEDGAARVETLDHAETVTVDHADQGDVKRGSHVPEGMADETTATEYATPTKAPAAGALAAADSPGIVVVDENGAETPQGRTTAAPPDNSTMFVVSPHKQGLVGDDLFRVDAVEQLEESLKELRAEVAGAFADGEGSEQAGLDKVLQHIDQVSDALLVYSAFLHDQGSTPDAAAADDNDAGEVPSAEIATLLKLSREYASMAPAGSSHRSKVNSTVARIQKLMAELDELNSSERRSIQILHETTREDGTKAYVILVVSGDDEWNTEHSYVEFHTFNRVIRDNLGHVKYMEFLDQFPSRSGGMEALELYLVTAASHLKVWQSVYMRDFLSPEVGFWACLYEADADIARMEDIATQESAAQLSEGIEARKTRRRTLSASSEGLRTSLALAVEDRPDVAMQETYAKLAEAAVAAFDAKSTKFAEDLRAAGNGARAPDLGDSKWIVGVAGMPGAGKSSLAAGVMRAINQKRPGAAVVLPMDGYHYTRAQLDAMDDPAEAHRRRGSPWTFDAPALLKFLRELRVEGEGSAPSFDHSVGDPVPADIDIELTADIVIVEGNYLLLPEPVWEDIAKVFDARWYLDVDIDTAMERVRLRHMDAFGFDEAAARERVEINDRPNAEAIAASGASRADRVVLSL